MSQQIIQQVERPSSQAIESQDFDIGQVDSQRHVEQLSKQLDNNLQAYSKEIQQSYQKNFKNLLESKEKLEQTYKKLKLREKKFYDKNQYGLAKIQKEKDDWEIEKQKIKELGAIDQDIIQLSVRGETKGFMVTRQLLQSVPGSNLANMFSGEHPIQKVDGKYFLNRDPKIFEYILEFLSNGLQLPFIKDDEIKVKFEKEMEILGLLSKSQIQIDFEKIFEAQPKYFTDKQKEVWSKIGPFDLDKYLKENIIEINSDIKIQTGTQNNSENLAYNYQRQEIDNQPHGITRRNFHVDGELQEGQFKNGQMDGMGRLIFGDGDFDGDYYIGEFKNHLKHGKGKYVEYNGTITKGIFIKGAFEDKINI